jgi:hypothetical protein
MVFRYAVLLPSVHTLFISPVCIPGQNSDDVTVMSQSPPPGDQLPPLKSLVPYKGDEGDDLMSQLPPLGEGVEGILGDTELKNAKGDRTDRDVNTFLRAPRYPTKGMKET